MSLDNILTPLFSIVPKYSNWASLGPGTKITKRRWRERKKRTGERVLNPSHMMALRRKGGGSFLCQKPSLEIIHIAGSQSRPFLRMWMVWSQALNGTGLLKTATLIQRCFQKMKFIIATLCRIQSFSWMPRWPQISITYFQGQSQQEGPVQNEVSKSVVCSSKHCFQLF